MGEATRRKKAGLYPDQTTKPTVIKEAIAAIEWENLGDLEAQPQGRQVVLQLIELKASAGKAGRGRRMMLRLETAEREPLLKVTTFGMPCWLQVVELFQEMGMEDRLAKVSHTVDGYDAIFYSP